MLIQQLPQIEELVTPESSGDHSAPFEDTDRAGANERLPQQQIQRLHKLLERYTEVPSGSENVERNALFAQDAFELDPIDLQILLLILRYEHDTNLARLADAVTHVVRNAPRAVADLIGVDATSALARLSSGSALIERGIIPCPDAEKANNAICGRSGQFRLSPALRRVMDLPFSSRAEWAAAIIEPVKAEPLDPADFENVAPDADFIVRLLRGSAARGAQGVNVLLYGVSETDRMTLARAIADRAGSTAWAAGDQDPVGSGSSRAERLSSLRLSQALLEHQTNPVLVIEDGEAVLAHPGSNRERQNDELKSMIVQSLRENATPVIWFCRTTGNINPSLLREMTLAVELLPPNPAVRARMWHRVLESESLPVSDQAIHRLATHYQAPLTVATSAARASALARGGAEEIEQALNGALRILEIDPPVDGLDDERCDLALVNCATDLDALTDQITGAGAPTKWSMCIQGPPGTGKSRYARHLADRLGMEVMQRRASDLISKWTGETEERIAAAFADARRRRAVLIFDEADSLLHDRREAVRRHEVSQVNEMLTWMENHPVPFICTTNLMERLDPASLRRFTLKLRFEPLSGAQAADAFERFFGVPAPCQPPAGLTPGDFATVDRKRRLLRSADPNQLMDWLGEEVAFKRGAPRTIGFEVKGTNRAR